MTTNTRSKKQAPAEAGANPAALIAGGVALGAVVGMLLPRIAKERELLDPVGHKLAERATAAVSAAKETGRAEIESLLPGRDVAKDRISHLIGNVADAVRDAASKKLR